MITAFREEIVLTYLDIIYSVWAAVWELQNNSNKVWSTRMVPLLDNIFEREKCILLFQAYF
jgi:hypothetical protein